MTFTQFWRYNTARAPMMAGILALASALFFGATLLTQRDASAQSPFGLTGTWRAEIVLVDCETGTPVSPAFASLLSYERGGTLTETTSSPLFQPGQRSPGHGIWKFQGAHTYSAQSEAYILFNTEPNPPMPGFVRGVQRISQTSIIVTGDEYVVEATVAFFDDQGNDVSSGCAKATGTRMTLATE